MKLINDFMKFFSPQNKGFISKAFNLHNPIH